MPTKKKSMDELLDAAKSRKEYVVNFLLSKIEECLPQTYVHLKSRVKSRKSLEKKLQIKAAKKPGYLIGNITDLVGIRFVCHFQSDVEQVIDLILRLNSEKSCFSGLAEDGRLYTTKSHNQDALSATIEKIFVGYGFKVVHEHKDSRYTSLHLVCMLKDFHDFPIEIQVRTVFEDAWSEIEHALKYKNEGIIPSSAEKHLRVLNSLVQTCSEYSEAIVGDIRMEPVEKSGVKPMVADPMDIMKSPEVIRALLKQVLELQKSREYAKAIEKISDYIESNKELKADLEAYYVVNMEKGICYLLNGNATEAIDVYNYLSDIVPDKAMIYFRIADAWRLLGEYNRAKEFFELANTKVASGGGSPEELNWLGNRLALKMAYVLWKQGETQAAYSQLVSDYERIKELGDLELIKLYLNSMSYYSIELAEKDKKPLSLEQLRQLMKELNEHGFSSTKSSDPEFVDTYAWICHLAGDHDAAYKAASELEAAIIYPEGPDAPFLSSNGRIWSISQSDLNLIQYHISLIKQASKKSHVS